MRGGYTLDSLKDLFDKNIRQVVLSTNSKLAEIVCELNRLQKCCSTKSGSVSIIPGTGIYITGSGTSNDPYIINVKDIGYITLDDLSAISPLHYNSSTGEFSISKASTNSDGYLSKEDWNTFNNNTSDKNYIYVQSTPRKVWEINHTLNKIPAVMVLDTAGSVITGEIEIVSTSHITLSFNAAISGQAILN